MTIDEIIEGIIKAEGGYVNHPNDKGGPTNWGITQAVARAHGYTGDMKNLPRQTAIDIYKQDYWFGPRFDQIAQVSPHVAEELADTGVNMGPSFQSKQLQRWLNAFSQQNKLYPDLAVDGAIGNRTVVALRAFLQARGSEGERVLLKALNASQAVRYLELTEARKANQDFVYGWINNRVNI